MKTFANEFPPEFHPKTKSIEQHFVVAESKLQSFINHLQNNKVFVQPAEDWMDHRGIKYLSLEVASAIPLADGEKLASTFKPETNSQTPFARFRQPLQR